MGEKFTFDLTWQQELGIESICPSDHGWFKEELKGLVEAAANNNQERVDYFKERILSQVGELVKSCQNGVKTEKKLHEIEN